MKGSPSSITYFSPRSATAVFASLEQARAVRGWISRSTAHRYFPSRELMYAEVLLTASVGIDRQQVYAAAEGEGDAAHRLDRVIRAGVDHAFTDKHKHALRAGLRAYLLLIDTYPDAPLEPSHRVRYLTAAIEPLSGQLSAEAQRRLVAALSLLVGIEPALITQGRLRFDGSGI